jgi:acyl carrier protein
MFKSFHHFPPQVGIRSLERALHLRLHQIVIADMDAEIAESTPKLRPFLSQLTYHSARNGSGSNGSNAHARTVITSLDARLTSLVSGIRASEPGADRERQMEALVEFCFRAHAGLAENDDVNRDQPLTLMGMDSLIGMEIRTRLSKLLELTIPSNAVQEHNSVRALAAYLDTLLFPQEGSDTVSVAVKDKERSEDKTEAGSGPGEKDTQPQPKKVKLKKPLAKFISKKLHQLQATYANAHSEKHQKSSIAAENELKLVGN